MQHSIASTTGPIDLRLVEFDLLRASEMAALNSVAWFGRGQKESADEAACNAIRGMFDRTEMRGEIVIGEGIKDEAPGLFAGERVGTWRDGTPRLDIAIDPLDGTTNLSKGLPNSICCIAAALRTHDDQPVLQEVPAFYMKKLAYPPAVRKAWVEDPSLPLDISAPISDVIKLTSRLLDKAINDIVVMVIDRPRNAELVEDIRRVGASLRMITDGDIAAALAPALSNQCVDLYAGIGGAPEGILAAAGMRCLGGGMQAQMWPRDQAERESLVQCGWSDRMDKVYRSRDLVHGDDVLFVATGISDSPLLRGIRGQGDKTITHSVLMRQRTGSVRFVRTEHNLSKRPLCLRSAKPDAAPLSIDSTQSVEPLLRRPDAAHSNGHQNPTSDRPAKIPAILLLGAPGSGKGTIGSAVAQLPGCTHCSSGDIIRGAIRDFEGYSTYAEKIARGELLGDQELFGLFDNFLATYRREIRSAGDFLLIDGIPRCRSQVALLNERVAVRAVLHLDCVDPNVLVDRLQDRRVTSGRSDDADRSVILQRLRLYDEETLPLLREFPPATVHRIDAGRPAVGVLREVLDHLAQVDLTARTRQMEPMSARIVGHAAVADPCRV
jgi:fructose-1,6-bisphosphatase II